MGRRKKTEGEVQQELVARGGDGGGLPSAPKAEEASALMKAVEFETEEAGWWRVEHYDRLAAEFSLEEADLPLFFETICGGGPSNRTGQIVQRLFGIRPVVPALDASEEDLRTWSRREVEEKYGLGGEELKGLLMGAGAVWKRRREKEESRPQTAEQGQQKGGDGPLSLGRGEGKEGSQSRLTPAATNKEEGGEELLKRYRFDEGMFQLPGRSAEVNESEKRWFIARLEEWKDLLSQAHAETLVRTLLYRDLAVERIRQEQARMSPTDKLYAGLSKLLRDAENEYEELWRTISEKFPIAQAISQRKRVQGLVSDFVQAYREWKENGDNTLVDGIFTALEIQVLCRASQQDPVPRYRAGLVASLLEAKAGLFDPEYRSRFKKSWVKKMDEGWRRAAEEVGAAAGEELPDLMKDGKGGEYEELEGIGDQ